VTAVRLQGLTKRYGDQEVVRAIDAVIPSGQVTCLLGPSGCGKTTTLRMVAGLEEPDGGTITIGEQVVAAPDIRPIAPEKRRLGMVFQSYAVWPHLDVRANVEYPLRVARVPPPERQTRVDRALELVGLGALGARSPSQLSGGQQQRVALARALVAEPQVLLLDEPLSNLDARLREDMRAEIAALQARTGVTVLYVTHDQEEALAIAHRIVVMNGGRIEQAATPAEVYHQPASRFVATFVGAGVVLPGAIVGARGDVLVRPEQVRLGDDEESTAQVLSVAYRGERALVRVTSGGRELLAWAPAGRVPRLGDTVRVTIVSSTPIPA